MTRRRAGIRVLLIGGGWVARSLWLPALERLGSSIRSVEVYDPDPQQLARLGNSGLRCVRTTGSDADAIGSADVALVLTPAADRVPAALSLVGRVGRVVLEKPAATVAEDLLALDRAARAEGTEVWISNTAPYRLDVAAFIEAARVTTGAGSRIEARWERRQGIPGRPRTFLSRRSAGGGALFDLGWHLLDVMDELVPVELDRPPRCDLVAGVDDPAVALASWHDDEVQDAVGEFDVEWSAVVTGQLTAGPEIELTASWATSVGRDRTQLTHVNGAAETQLTCTFGFSPDRTPEASLRRSQAGWSDVRPFDNTTWPAFHRQAATLLVDPAEELPARHAVEAAVRKLRFLNSCYDVAYRAVPR